MENTLSMIPHKKQTVQYFYGWLIALDIVREKYHRLALGVKNGRRHWECNGLGVFMMFTWKDNGVSFWLIVLAVQIEMSPLFYQCPVCPVFDFEKKENSSVWAPCCWSFVVCFCQETLQKHENFQRKICNHIFQQRRPFFQKIENRNHEKPQVFLRTRRFTKNHKNHKKARIVKIGIFFGIRSEIISEFS